MRVATTGREALELAKTGQFDVLLLDIHMPELDGFQVIRAIREREEAAGGHLPVIALTARSRKEDRERCLAAGMDEFLAKPIQAGNLWAAIDRLGTAVRESGDASHTPTTASPGPEAVLLDPRAVLAACGGDGAILVRISQAFRTGLPGQLEALRVALRGGDAGRLRETAHRLCGMVGAFSTVAGEMASDLEDRAAQGRLDEARPLVARLETIAGILLKNVDGLTLESLKAI